MLVCMLADKHRHYYIMNHDLEDLSFLMGICGLAFFVPRLLFGIRLWLWGAALKAFFGGEGVAGEHP